MDETSNGSGSAAMRGIQQQNAHAGDVREHHFRGEPANTRPERPTSIRGKLHDFPISVARTNDELSSKLRQCSAGQLEGRAF